MHGNWSTKGPGDAGVHLADATLDSRARATPGRGDGNIDLEGRTTTPGANGLSSQAGLQLDDAHLSSGRGSITLSGSSTNNDGLLCLEAPRSTAPPDRSWCKAWVARWIPCGARFRPAAAST
jgi:hypothetical protein